jgi:7-carboxy-7-deazaguanine synthase
MLDIVEEFITLSGEAPYQGKPVYLIRFSRCNLDCGYCDTPYRDEVNLRLSPAELTRRILEHTSGFPGLRVLLTGGEPLLPERREILRELISGIPGTEFLVETNGSLPLAGFFLDNCRLIVDWKTPSSSQPDSFFMDNLPVLRPANDCIKFVLGSADLYWVKDRIRLIQEQNRNLPVFLSPQWSDKSIEKIAEFILKEKLDAGLSLQLHKIVWGPGRRGV